MTVDEQHAQLISDLKAARAELVTRGRCRGTLVSAGGQVCAIGSVGVATVDGFLELVDEDARYDSIHASARAQRVWDVLEEHVPDRKVMFFNDDSTDRDVLDLFDKALAELGGLA